MHRFITMDVIQIQINKNRQENKLKNTMLSINQLSGSKDHRNYDVTANNRRLQRSDRSQNSKYGDKSYKNNMKDDPTNKSTEGFRLYLQSSQEHSSMSSRQLLRRCKEVIKEQMVQIQELWESNQEMVQQLGSANKRQSQLHGMIQTNKKQYAIQKQSINKQYVSCVQKNQMLHKQLNKRSLQIQSFKRMLLQRQQTITTKDQQLKEKNQSILKLEQCMIKLEQQCCGYQQQINRLEKALEQMKNENDYLEQVMRERDEQVRVKQNQWRDGVSRLGKVSKMIERNNRFEEEDLDRRNNLLNQHNRNNPQLNTIMSINSKGTATQHPIPKSNQFFTIQQPNPFKAISFKHHLKNNFSNNKLVKTATKNVYMSGLMNNNRSQGMIMLSNEDNGKILNNRDNELSPNVARIRKNVARSQCKDQSTKAKSSNKFDNSGTIHQQSSNSHKHNSISHKQNSIRNIKHDKSIALNPTHFQTLNNPQLTSQLSTLKQSILQQYSLLQTKKQKLNNERINFTLHQIESKLQKMKFIVKDQTQSQFQDNSI